MTSLPESLAIFCCDERIASDCDLCAFFSRKKHPYCGLAAGWVRPPPRGARRKPLCEFPCCEGCLRCCALCLRYLYGMLYVSPCLECLSQLGHRMKEWAKRRNILLGRKLDLRLFLVYCVSGAVPRAGSSSELSVLWSPGMTSQKTGAAHGPRHPSCSNNQDMFASS